MAKYRRRKIYRRKKFRRIGRRRRSGLRKTIKRTVQNMGERIVIYGSKRMGINTLGPSTTSIDPAIGQGYIAGTVSIDRGDVWGRLGVPLATFQDAPFTRCMKGNKIQREMVKLRIVLVPTLCVRTQATGAWGEWYVPATYAGYDITGTVATYNAGTRIAIGYQNRNVDRLTMLQYLLNFQGQQTTDFSFTIPFDRNVFVPVYDKIFYTSLAAQKPTIVNIFLKGKRGKKNIVIPYDLTTGDIVSYYPPNGNMILFIYQGHTNWIDPRTAGNTLYDRIACINEVNAQITCVYKDMS